MKTGERKTGRDLKKGKEPRNGKAGDVPGSGGGEDSFPELPAGQLLNPGSFVRFGHFRQGKRDTGEAVPVEWLVLERRWNEVLLISRHGLAGRRFHDRPDPVSWADSDLRYWLNHDFLNTAFSAGERRAIRLFAHSDEDLSGQESSGSGIVRDYVFCLSIAEASRYFRDDESRRCRPTEYARLGYGTEIWMLRSPGAFPDQVATVNGDGSVYPYGWNAGEYFSVRPALWVGLRLPENSGSGEFSVKMSAGGDL